MWFGTAVAGVSSIFASLVLVVPTVTAQNGQSQSQVEVYASGFVNPKQLAFGADGSLYVAESGQPGEISVPLPINFGGSGPIGTNGRVSRVPAHGSREDFITGLPNIGLYRGGEMLGPTGLTTLDGQLYELA